MFKLSLTITSFLLSLGGEMVRQAITVSALLCTVSSKLALHGKGLQVRSWRHVGYVATAVNIAEYPVAGYGGTNSRTCK